MHFQVCLLLCLAILCNFAQGHNKVLYLIRHGNSVWNSAGGLTVVGDYLSNHKNLHDASLTDAPLTAKGLLDAFSVCRAVFGVIDQVHNTNYQAQCSSLGQELAGQQKITWTPKTGALDKKTGKDIGLQYDLTHAEILAGKAVNNDLSPMTTHVTSNLVRAIDTMFFSVFPSLQDGSIAQIAATSFCQEVGGGWDGSVHQTRMKGCLYAGIGDVKDAECIRSLHTGQRTLLTNLLANLPTSRNLNLLQRHELFYSDKLIPTPRHNDAQFWKYQLEVEGTKRKEISVQSKMFKDFISLIHTNFDTPYVVVAGHSHYFAHFLKLHSAEDDERCQTFAKAMQDNGAIWRVNLDTTTQRISNCKIVFGKFKRGGITQFRLNNRVQAIEDEDYAQNVQQLEERARQLEASVSSLEGDLMAMTNY